MRPLLKIMIPLALIFASTFLIARAFGLLTEDSVRGWLTAASLLSPWWIAALVIALLMADIAVAVPTLTITILAGYFLGAPLGAAAAFAGTFLASVTGFGLSRRYGDGIVAFVLRDADQRADMADTFRRGGPAMILLSRAAPILPEVTACMAGATGMPLPRYLLYFALGTLPYVSIAAYAGSVSTLEDPMPAIYAAIGLYGVMWAGWAAYRASLRRGNHPRSSRA